MNVLQLLLALSFFVANANTEQSLKGDNVFLFSYGMKTEAYINGPDPIYTAFPEECAVVGMPDNVKAA